MRPLLPLLLAACTGPVEPLARPAGAMTIHQLDLGGPATGESALIVGPDGTSALLDVGNDRHAGTVRDAVIAATGQAAVDWILLTHFHADHIGAFEHLELEVRQGVITRGWVDLEHANRDEIDEIRAVLDDETHQPLCDEAACPGVGRVLDLGGGARLVIDVANAHVGPTDRLLDPGEEENARSLAGRIEYGAFRYQWASDLTGGGKGTPDVEGALVTRGLVHPANVVHLNHHGIRSSSSAAWLDAVLPDDGHVRHAIVGANGVYLAAPHEHVLEAVAPRLGGGRIWASNDGSLAGEHEALCVAKGDVVVTVEAGSYSVGGGRCAAVRQDL